MNAASGNQAEFYAHGCTILVVDDEPSNLRLVSECLREHGCSILVARDGPSALEKARYGRPDLILLDVLMPGIDGFEICRRLKADEALRDIPVIFTTSLTETQHKVRGFQLGAVDYLTKPFQYEELLARVTTHLHLRELTEHLELRVRERTAELSAANQQLRQEIAERERAEEAVLHSEQLAAVGELAAGVAHELNNPLTSVLGFAELLLRRKSSDDPDWQILNTIAAEAHRARKTVRGLLNFSRQGEFHQEWADINQVMQDTLALVRQRLAKQNVVVEERYASTLPSLLLDAGQMKQVFLNLIVNALHAMPQGGTLTVESERAGNEVAVRVTDTGEGIPTEHLPRIFQPFFTTKPKGQGTGLGLSISLGIVQQHGGHIEVESQVGEGSTFTVWLPTEEEAS